MLCITAVMRRDCPLWQIDHRPILRSQVMQGVCATPNGGDGDHFLSADPSRVMSALPSKADIAERDHHVRFVPEAESCTAEINGSLKAHRLLPIIRLH
jgi:hypothetical protein